MAEVPIGIGLINPHSQPELADIADDMVALSMPGAPKGATRGELPQVNYGLFLGGELVGVAIVSDSPDPSGYDELKYIVIRPDVRRRKLGSYLLRFVEERTAGNGHAAVIARVLTDEGEKLFQSRDYTLPKPGDGHFAVKYV